MVAESSLERQGMTFIMIKCTVKCSHQDFLLSDLLQVKSTASQITECVSFNQPLQNQLPDLLILLSYMHFQLVSNYHSVQNTKFIQTFTRIFIIKKY